MTDDRSVRAGDRERAVVQDRLRDAYGQGALTVDEYEDRLTTALESVWVSDLRELVVDLPEPRDGSTTELASSSSTVPGPRDEPANRVRASTIGGPSRIVAGLLAVAAVWVVQPWDLDAAAIFSGTTVRAEAGEGIRVLSVFGSTEVVVGEGTPVDSDTFALFGSTDCDEVCAIDGDRPVTVSGVALFGSIEIGTGADED